MRHRSRIHRGVGRAEDPRAGSHRGESSRLLGGRVDLVVVRTELKEVQAEIQKTETVASDKSTEPGRVASAHLRELIERENWLAAELELYGDPPPPTMRPYEEYGPSGIDETAGGEPPAP